MFAPTLVDENGNSWIGMYAIVQSEKSEDALKWVLETMCKFCPGLVDKVRTVFTDRGVAEHLIQGIFRNAKALLCTFHIGLNLNARWGKLPHGVAVGT